MSIEFPNSTAKIFKSSDNSYYIYSNGLGTIVKLDSFFNYVTSRYFSLNPFVDIQNCMIELNDSSLLIGGGIFTSNDCYIDRFDKNLNSMWRGQYGPTIGMPVTLNQVDNNTIMVLTTIEGGLPNDRSALFAINPNGVIKKSGIFNYAKSATTYLPTQSDSKNGKYLFLNSEILPQNQFANYFNIYCTDTTLNNICNLNNSIINSLISPAEPQDSVLFTILVTQDSLINETMVINNVNFVYGECSDTILNIQSPFANEMSIILFPNPISNELTIQTTGNEPKEIILRDISARVILRQKFTRSISLNVQQLSNGLYLYDVRDKNGLLKKGKLVKD